MKIKKYFPIVLVFILSLADLSLGAETKPSLIVFYSPNCQKCIRVRRELMPRIEQKYKDKIYIRYLDIDNIENYKLLLSYEQKYDQSKKNLPIFFIEGRFVSTEVQAKKYLEAVILDSLKLKSFIRQDVVATVDLLARFKSFSVLAIVGAGLVDGINPCAFTVIVFFIGFLTLQRYRKKEIAVVSLCFIFSVFLVYLLLGMGLFKALYSLRSFTFLSRLFYFLVAALAFILGIFSIYDIIKFKKTADAKDMVLVLPEKIKYYIHFIIGAQYRQMQNQDQRSRRMSGLILSAIATGALVSLLEAVCTGQMYLPTITFVLKLSPFKFQAFIYLLLYNLMFILPLLAVFFFALLGINSQQFAQFMRKHLVTIKIFMAILFFTLGLVLIWKV